MNLAELQNLDPGNIGSWPAPIKALLIMALCAAVLGGGVYLDTREQLAILDEEEKKEVSLKETFEVKARKAANLEPLKQLLAEMKESFGAMLRLLPNRTEIEGLLVDISQSGLASGLEFELFKPGKEVPQEFYAIQPIQIQVTGTYHEFGEFVSAVAALPRIVTQHNVSIVPKNEELVMKMVARTYRYLEEEEIAEAASKKNSKGKRRKGRKGRKGKKKRK